MNIQDVINASSNVLPKVVCSYVPEHATSNIGVVTVIKIQRGYRGIAVSFPGVPYDHWFYEEDASDKRRKYMRDLSLSPEQ